MASIRRPIRKIFEVGTSYARFMSFIWGYTRMGIELDGDLSHNDGWSDWQV